MSYKFKATTIAPKGRNKYGNYLSADNAFNAVKKVQYSGNGTIGGGSSQDSDVGGEDKNYIVMLSKNSNAFDGMQVAIGPVTDTVKVIGYKGQRFAPTFVGKIDGESPSGATEDYAITGLTSGVTVTVVNNGTTGTTMEITLDSSCTETSGTLSIPCSVCTDKDVDSATTVNEWEWLYQQGETITLILEYSWSMSSNATSVYNLDLDNENASVNATSGGTIYQTSVPYLHCKATLYYGMEELSGVTYGLILPQNRNLTGVSINPQTGDLLFGMPQTGYELQFDGSPIEMIVTAQYNGLTTRKIFSLSKSFDGSGGDDGEPAVSYWLVLSTRAFHVNKNVSPVSVEPENITATAMMQIGQNEPITATGVTIYYGYTPNPATIYTSGITPNIEEDNLYFVLKKGNKIVDGVETVPILKDGTDGKDGEDGHQGRQGAAIVGPLKWDDTDSSTRRFCNGLLTDTAHPEDALWIHVILRVENNENIYYYCNTSYTGHFSDNWDDVKNNWTAADKQFDFIATNLLLAKNAAIDFLTGNEIYLRDENNVITAGAAGGSGINFWAGPTDNGTHLENAPFRVYNNGDLIANRGYFSAAIQQPYVNISSSEASSQITYSGRSFYYLNQISKTYLFTYDANSENYTCNILLPTPSADYNGVTYNIIISPMRTKSDVGQARIEVNGDYIYNLLQGNENSISTTTIFARAGFIQIACVPLFSVNSPKWTIVYSTCALDCMDGSVTRPLITCNKIQASNTPGNDSTTLYIKTN